VSCSLTAWNAVGGAGATAGMGGGMCTTGSCAGMLSRGDSSR